jgi:Histone acetyl transferase HAT1 N-terminus
VLWRTLTTDKDYFKDRATFEQQVEKDATTFKPMGKKIYSYSRQAGARSDAERRGQVDTSVNEEDESAAVFEVYHVSHSMYREAFSDNPCRRRGKPLAFWNTTDGCSCSSYYTSKLGAIFKRTKTNGNLLSCASVALSQFIPYALLGLRDASGKMVNLCTTSSGTPPCTPSTIIQTAHGYD